jgi:hypothetical protein
MPRPSNREEALEKLRASIAKGYVVVGAGAGRVNVQDHVDNTS